MNKPHFSVLPNRPERGLRFRCRKDSFMTEHEEQETEPSDKRADAISEVPSVEALRLMLQRQSDAGEDVLAEIRRKVADGSYLTRESAELSARRLLDGGDV